MFQVNDLEARGVNALEVAVMVVCVCARVKWGVAVSTRDTKESKGDIRTREEK